MRFSLPEDQWIIKLKNHILESIYSDHSPNQLIYFEILWKQIQKGKTCMQKMHCRIFSAKQDTGMIEKFLRKTVCAFYVGGVIDLTV